MPTTIRLPSPPDFRFAPTAMSHGWCELPPFSFDAESRTLGRVQKLKDGAIVALRMREGGDGQAVNVAVDGAGKLTAAQRVEIRGLVSRCLNTEQNLRPFYRMLRGQARYAWVSRLKVGRLLVSPTVWEDLAKTLLTTNTTWGGTTQMCRRLVALGEAHSDGRSVFPTPEQVASMKVDALSKRVRAGYRTAYLHELATALAEGRIDVEAWRGDPGLSTEDLYRRVRGLKGFGEYATGTVLKLLGRFDRLGIDTVCRDAFRTELNRGKPAPDERIREYYEPYGDWRGLVLWMDVMSIYLKPRLQ